MPAARQTRGYRGFRLLDQGDDKRLALLLFDRGEDAGSAQQALTPVGRDHTYALMTSPDVGAGGAVLVADGLFTEPVEP